jgi:hypothetical protein
MRLLTVAAVLMLAGAAGAQEECYREVPLLNQEGAARVPTSIFADVPAWASAYTPLVDRNGKVWLYANLQDGSLVWVLPKTWRGPNSEAKAMTTNYGVDLGLVRQAPGTLITNDQSFGEAVMGTSTSEQCPLPTQPTLPSLPSLDASTAIVAGALVLSGLLFVVGLRRRT